MKQKLKLYFFSNELNGHFCYAVITTVVHGRCNGTLIDSAVEEESNYDAREAYGCHAHEYEGIVKWEIPGEICSGCEGESAGDGRNDTCACRRKRPHAVDETNVGFVSCVVDLSKHGQ